MSIMNIIELEMCVQQTGTGNVAVLVLIGLYVLTTRTKFYN